MAACARNDRLRPANADRIKPAYKSAATASVAVVNATLLRATSLILIAMPLNQLTAAVARQCTRKRSTVASSSGNRRQVGWCFINKLALSEPTKGGDKTDHHKCAQQLLQIRR